MAHDKNIYGRISPYSGPQAVLDGKCYKFFVRFDDNKNSFDKRYIEYLDSIKNNADYARDDICNSFAKTFDLPVKTIDDSAIFSDLWKALKQDDCTYQIYCRDLIEDGYIPKYVSCLVKENGILGNLKECIGSRLCNYMGIETVYNMMQAMVVSDGEAQANGFETRNTHLISVDFIPNGFEFASLEHLQMNVNPEDSLEKNLRIACTMWYYYMSRDLGITLTKRQIDNFERDFCMQYLFRRVLCHEGDYKGKNVGVLYSKDHKTFHLAPSFDMEFLFCDDCPTIEEDIQFIAKRYPAEMLGFASRLKQAMEEDAFSKIIDSMPQFPLFTADMKKIKESLWQNSVQICEICNNIHFYDRQL